MFETQRNADHIPSIYKAPATSTNPGSEYLRKLDREHQTLLDRYAAQKNQKSNLDSAQGQQLHANLLAQYSHELERQAENRMQMAVDEDIYDHNQWTEAELRVLEQRGQAPLVFNLTQTSVNWVLGSQRRATMDYKILPRLKDGQQAAESKSQLLKYLADANRSEYEYSAAFADAVKAGIGWMETGQGSVEDATTVFDRRESWRNMLWDSTSQRYDLTDARYLFRSKWMDLDTSSALFSDRVATLRTAAHDTSRGFYASDDFGDDAMDFKEEQYVNASGTPTGNTQGQGMVRPRLRVMEGWFKKALPAVPVMKGGQFHGELFDEWSEGHWTDLKDQRATLALRPREVVHVAIMCESGLLMVRESPYRHNRYPFTPVWGYRRARDGMPYGIIRGMRDINRDLNKRASKSLHLLSSKTIIAPAGSFEDLDETRDEVARPDAIITYKPTAGPPPVMSTDTNLAAAHMELMSRDAQMLQQVAGVTDENMGRQSNARSGKAIIARQDQGQLATSHFSDNLRQSRAIHGEKLLINVEQFMTEKEQFRVTDSRGNAKFLQLNDGDPANAIAMFKADFVISEADWSATMRQAQASELMELMSQLSATAPEAVFKCLDLLVEALDIPNKDEIVKRIRQLNGQADPDEDPENPSEETLALQEKGAMEQEAQMIAMKTQLEDAQAKIRKTNAEAAKIESALTTDSLAQIEASLRAALAVSQTPQIVRAADLILNAARGQSGVPPEPTFQNEMIAPQSPMEQPPMGAQPPMPPAPQPIPQPAMQGV